MYKLVVMLRVKDGILFINDWLKNMERLVDEIVVVDNGSTDGTLEILRKHSKVVDIAETVGFDEGRDKIMAYEMARKRNPNWCLWLDVDEIFEERMTREKFDKYMKSKIFTKYCFRRFHFHKDYQHFESGYEKLSAIAWPDRVLWKEQALGFFKNLKIHNGLIQGIKGFSYFSNIRLKHYGQVDKDYLEKKTKNYINVDPERKDMYIKHFKQSLPVWQWYEYHEKPIFVSLQNIFFTSLMTLQIFKKIPRKLLKMLKLQ